MTNPPEVVLQRALVAVYPLYLADAVASLGVEADPGALAQGQAWLATELEELLSLPFEQQARGPFEVFQEATRFVGDWLAEVGVDPPKRSDGDRRALPGDVYALAPLTSRDLGRTVWEAHLRWGAAKAAGLD